MSRNLIYTKWFCAFKQVMSIQWKWKFSISWIMYCYCHVLLTQFMIIQWKQKFCTLFDPWCVALINIVLNFYFLWMRMTTTCLKAQKYGQQGKSLWEFMTPKTCKTTMNKVYRIRCVFTGDSFKSNFIIINWSSIPRSSMPDVCLRWRLFFLIIENPTIVSIVSLL